ncbi:hypothetical protein [Bacillus sp. NPDC094106]|uniref:hypothetical protein n=1 Tax=Bacillus sp. NPDC094106 TaxID=3363949 RepID=UPI0037F503A5
MNKPKGSLGVSTTLVNRNKKQTKAYKGYMKERFPRKYHTSYRCPVCWTKDDSPSKTEQGILFCGKCFLKTGKKVEVNEIKTYSVQEVSNKELRQKNQKRNESNKRKKQNKKKQKKKSTDIKTNKKEF